MKLRFEKWEGLGNDFVVVEGGEGAISAERARAICDRRRGVGADGVLVVSAAAMIVWNADGSRPEMCGNGLRCAAAFLARKRGDEALELELSTDAGPRACRVERAFAESATVEADMGKARVVGADRIDNHDFTLVDVGNPHAVTFDVAGDHDLDALAAQMQARRPGGANVEFAEVLAERIDVVVVERGVGRTLACGTGAVAVAAAACERGARSFGEPIDVRLPGGALVVRVERDGRAKLTGPARRVFSGEVDLP